MTDDDWPENINKPKLPKKYHWQCLRQALGIGEEPDHPWYIRVSWNIKNGKQRMLKTQGYFNTPVEAIDFAMKKIADHMNKRAKLDD